MTEERLAELRDYARYNESGPMEELLAEVDRLRSTPDAGDAALGAALRAALASVPEGCSLKIRALDASTTVQHWDGQYEPATDATRTLASLLAALSPSLPLTETRPRDEGDQLPQISFEYGGRDVWHTDCPNRRHSAPMKHLQGRLPIGDGVVLHLYECTVCAVRVFGGCDRAGHLVRRAAQPATEEG